MSVRQLVQAALLGALELVVFAAFSGILYLEAVTFTIVCVALCLDRRIAVLSYLAIYPLYSLGVSCLRTRQMTSLQAALVTGCLSFLTGQLLQIPWMLFSRVLAAGYLLLGLQTSLIQGVLSVILTLCLFRPVCAVLKTCR